ncbi:MAG: hypothetical protein ACI959_002190, partial [Limisphaerales bacterium]
MTSLRPFKSIGVKELSTFFRLRHKYLAEFKRSKGGFKPS